MAREYWSWRDGQYTNPSDISPHPGSTLNGYGAFETIYFDTQGIHYLYEHLERFRKAISHYQLNYSPDEGLITEVITSLIKKNALTQARVRLTLYRISPETLDSGLFPCSLEVTTLPYERPSNAATLITASADQFHCPLNSHKSTDYSSYLAAREYAQCQGADDTLLSDVAGNYIECSTSNLFLLKNGKWFTPDLKEGGLPGIYRQITLNAMVRIGIPCHIRPVTTLDVDYGFITNSLTGIRPIAKINNLALKPTKEDLSLVAEIREKVEIP